MITSYCRAVRSGTPIRLTKAHRDQARPFSGAAEAVEFFRDVEEAEKPQRPGFRFVGEDSQAFQADHASDFVGPCPARLRVDPAAHRRAGEMRRLLIGVGDKPKVCRGRAVSEDPGGFEQDRDRRGIVVGPDSARRRIVMGPDDEMVLIMPEVIGECRGLGRSNTPCVGLAAAGGEALASTFGRLSAR